MMMMMMMIIIIIIIIIIITTTTTHQFSTFHSFTRYHYQLFLLICLKY
jgi:hypothetical protein